MSTGEGVQGDLRSLASVRAPCCGHSASLLELFDAVTSAFRGKRWIRFDCPGCKTPALINLEDDATAWGYNADPGGRFFTPRLRIQQAGLEVSGGPEGLVVQLLHRRWFFPRCGD